MSEIKVDNVKAVIEAQKKQAKEDNKFDNKITLKLKRNPPKPKQMIRMLEPKEYEYTEWKAGIRDLGINVASMPAGKDKDLLRVRLNRSKDINHYVEERLPSYIDPYLNEDLKVCITYSYNWLMAKIEGRGLIQESAPTGFNEKLEKSHHNNNDE